MATTLRHVLSGMLKESQGVHVMGEWERRAAAWRVAAAIGNAQDVVHDMCVRYDKHAHKQRRAMRACEEGRWQDAREEHSRFAADVRAQRKEIQHHTAGVLEAQRRSEHQQAQAAATQEERKRRAQARNGGGEVAVTRAMSKAGALVSVGLPHPNRRRLIPPTHTCTFSHRKAPTSDKSEHMRPPTPKPTPHECECVSVPAPHPGVLDFPVPKPPIHNTPTPRQSLSRRCKRAAQAGEAYAGTNHPKRRHTRPLTYTAAASRPQRTPRPPWDKRRPPPRRLVYVHEMHDPRRWERRGPDLNQVWYQEHDNTWIHVYDICRSPLLTRLYPDDAPHADDMLGLIAARAFRSEEIITIYAGIPIGEVHGVVDGYRGYHAMEQMERRGRGNTGRHVMAIDGRLIDGYEGFTGAQYANAAYRAPKGISNNARMKAGGTLAVMKGKTIHPGDEILYAYHHSYWQRWAPSLSLPTTLTPSPHPIPHPIPHPDPTLTLHHPPQVCMGSAVAARVPAVVPTRRPPRTGGSHHSDTRASVRAVRRSERAMRWTAISHAEYADRQQNVACRF